MSLSVLRAAGSALKERAYELLPRRSLNLLLRSRMPRTAVLEVTTACNLECPLCPTHYVPRASRFLAGEHVQDVIDSCVGSLKAVCFHIQGEPTVHPDLFGLVRRCELAGISSYFGTNGMLLDRCLDEIFDSGLDVISIDVDGATAEDYAKYRVRGDFERVVANTRALIAEKRRRGSRKPLIQVQTVMFSYNEEKESLVRSFLETLGADQIVLKRPSYYHDIEHGKRKGLEISPALQEKADAAARKFLGLVEQDRADLKYSRPDDEGGENMFRSRRVCPQLEKATVLSDGRVVACCMDGIGMTAFGDLNEESFADVWRGERHREVLERFMERKLELCETCTLGAGG